MCRRYLKEIWNYVWDARYKSDNTDQDSNDDTCFDIMFNLMVY
jgi:hypothetical protein